MTVQYHTCNGLLRHKEPKITAKKTETNVCRIFDAFQINNSIKIIFLFIYFGAIRIYFFMSY